MAASCVFLPRTWEAILSVWDPPACAGCQGELLALSLSCSALGRRSWCPSLCWVGTCPTRTSLPACSIIPVSKPWAQTEMQLPEPPLEHLVRAAHGFQALPWDSGVVHCDSWHAEVCIEATFPRVVGCTLVSSFSKALNTSLLCHPECCSPIIIGIL